MAWEKAVFDLPGLITSVDLSGTTGSTNGYNSTAQFLFAKISADETVVIAAIGDIPIGVIQNNAKVATGYANVGAAVRHLGISKIMCGASGLTAGALVGPDANGAGVPRVVTSGGADAGRYVGGVVIKGANSGELATMLCLPAWVIQA